MYSTYNEGKSVVAERLGPWQTKFNKILTLHQILMLNRMKILMKKVSKFRVAIRVRISEQKNILKDTLKIGQKKFLSLLKLATQFRGHKWLVI